MTTEMWLAIISLVSSGGAAIWVVVKVIIPQLVMSRLEEARDSREHRQVLESREAQSTAAEREANQRLTLTLNQNIIGTLERSMADATTANEAIRERFYNRLDAGMNHIYGEMDGIRLEIRRMDANYGQLAQGRHLAELENYGRLEKHLERLGAIVMRLAAVVQTAYGVEVRLPEEVDDQQSESEEDAA